MRCVVQQPFRGTGKGAAMEPILTAILTSILSGVGGNVATAVAGALVNLVISYLIVRKFYKSRIAVLILTLFTALVATIFSFFYLSNPANHELSTIVIIFLTSVILWMVFFHVGSLNYGYLITTINFGKWSVLSANWVRAIDYIYLTLSTLSVLRIVVSAAVVGNGVVYFNAVASVLLGFAVAMRITRTSIEIFGWDRRQRLAS